MREHDLEIQWLRSFQTVAETGSMTASAERLCRSQSAISMHIKKIEDLLERKVFFREVRRLTLTPAGKDLLSYSDQILRTHSLALSALKQKAPHGHVSLGIPDDYAARYLSPLLRTFSQKYPGIELSLLCEPSSSLIPKIDAGELDVAIVSQDRPDRGVWLASIPLVWVGNLANTQGDLPEPLPVAMYELGSEARKNLLKALEKMPGGYRIVYNSPYIAGQIAAAESGMAMAVLTKCCVPEKLNISNHQGLPDLPVHQLAVVRSKITETNEIISLLVDEIQNIVR